MEVLLELLLLLGVCRLVPTHARMRHARMRASIVRAALRAYIVDALLMMGCRVKCHIHVQRQGYSGTETQRPLYTYTGRTLRHNKHGHRLSDTKTKSAHSYMRSLSRGTRAAKKGQAFALQLPTDRHSATQIHRDTTT